MQHYQLRSRLRRLAPRGLTLSAVFCMIAGQAATAAASSGPTAVNETFKQNAGTMAPVAGGTWTAGGGLYKLTSPAPAPWYGNGNMSISSVPLTGDFTVTASVNTPSGSEFSVILDYSDPQNYSYVHYSTVAHDFSQGIFQMQSGVSNEVAAFDYKVSSGSLQTVKVKYESGKVKAYVGSTYLTGTDLSVRSGAHAGLGSVSSAVSFGPFSVAGATASSSIAPLPQTTVQPPAATTMASSTACSAFQAIRTVPVATTAQLNAALASAQPGDDIQVADGTYTGGFVISNISGSPDNSIRLSGSPAAVLNGGSVSGSYVLHLSNANNWCIDGLTVTNGSKGIVTDNSSNNVLQNLDVNTVGDEAVHFRSCSDNNTLQGSHVHNTGLRNPGFGEGVYIGTASSNWDMYNYCTPGQPDASNYNQVLSNSIDHTTAENVDIKEGTYYGVLSGNVFDGAGISGSNSATSTVNVKGAFYTLTGNTITQSDPSTTAMVDGMQTYVVPADWSVTHSGLGITFSNNTFTFPYGLSGYGVEIKGGSVTNVLCNNTSTGAALGLSNEVCSQ